MENEFFSLKILKYWVMSVYLNFDKYVDIFEE